MVITLTSISPNANHAHASVRHVLAQQTKTVLSGLRAVITGVVVLKPILQGKLTRQ